MKLKEFIRFSNSIELSQYGLVVEGYWHEIADDDKVLLNKYFAFAVVDTIFGIRFRDAQGNVLEQPYIEQPEDYDEILVSEYRKTHPDWIDPRDIPVPNE